MGRNQKRHRFGAEIIGFRLVVFYANVFSDSIMKIGKLLFILLACIFLFGLAACDTEKNIDDQSDDQSEPDDDDDNLPPRTFNLAAAAFFFEVTDSSISSEFSFDGFEGRVDIVSVHLDGFFGVPWDEFSIDIDPPSPWIEKMEAIRNSVQDLETAFT